MFSEACMWIFARYELVYTETVNLIILCTYFSHICLSGLLWAGLPGIDIFQHTRSPRTHTPMLGYICLQISCPPLKNKDLC